MAEEVTQSMGENSDDVSTEKTLEELIELNRAQLQENISDMQKEINEFILKVNKELAEEQGKINQAIEKDIPATNNKLETEINKKFSDELNKITQENAENQKNNNTKIDKYITEQKGEINNAIIKIKQENKNDIDLQKSELEKYKKEIDIKIETLITGWKAKIAEIEKQNDDIFEKNEKERADQFSDLKGQILGLLPQASAVGISKAYSDAKDAHEKSMEWYRWAFIATICAMFWAPFVANSFGLITGFFGAQNGEINIQNFLFSGIRLAAIEAPLIWIATLMAKKIQQHQRIHEEYVHKYTAAMTFVGMSKEAKDNTKIFGEDHVKKLTEGFRDAVYMNPSKTLDKDVKAESPIEMVSSLVKKLGTDTVKNLIDNAKN